MPIRSCRAGNVVARYDWLTRIALLALLALSMTCPVSGLADAFPDTKVVRLQGVDFRVNYAKGGYLERHLRKTGLRRKINGGRLCVNEACEGYLSILVLAPRRAGEPNVGRLNAAFDREFDAVFLDESTVSIPDKRLPDLSEEERAKLSFTEFILFHEVGHRELGAATTPLFFFRDRAFSDYQLEEMAADEWALRHLVSDSVNDQSQKSEYLLSVIDGALYHFFGSALPLESVTKEHPSMLRRILAVVTNPEFQKLSADIGNLFTELAWVVDSELQGVARLVGDAEIDSVANCGGDIFVLTRSGGITAVSLSDVVWPVASLNADDRTVRKYFEGDLPVETELLGPIENGQRRSLVCGVGDKKRLYLVESNRDALTLYAVSLDRRRLEKLWVTSAADGVWWVDRAVAINDELLVPGYDDWRYLVAGYRGNSGGRVISVVPKDARFGPAQARFLSVRPNRLLVEADANGLVEVFELDYAGNARLAISTSRGSGIELCGELHGLAVLWHGDLDMLDACPTCDVKMAAPNCRLANLSQLGMAAWILGPDRPSLMRVTEDNMWKNANPANSASITNKRPCRFVIAPDKGRSIYVFDADQLGLDQPPEDMWAGMCNFTCETALSDGLLKGSVQQIGRDHESRDFIDLQIHDANGARGEPVRRLLLNRKLDTAWSVPRASVAPGTELTVIVRNRQGFPYANLIFPGSSYNSLAAHVETRKRFCGVLLH